MKRHITGKAEGHYDAGMDEELEGLEGRSNFLFEEYDVEYPSEEMMMSTIEAIKPYVPAKEHKIADFYHKAASIFKYAAREALYISPLFWAVNGVFLLLAFVLVFTDGTNPYLLVMVLAPIPTITGLFEVTKSTNAVMAELELSFKYSLQEIILSRMAVIGGVNLLVNGLFAIGVSFILPDLWIWKLTLYWVIPFTVVTALSFIVISRFPRNYGITASLALWIALGVLLHESQFTARMEGIPVWVWLLIAAAAVVTAAFQIVRIHERGIAYEFNN